MDHDPSSSVRIAVLIDADNTSPKYAEALLEELAKYGTPTIKRAYGDFSSQRLSGWTRELNARAIRAIHQNAFTVGKNSTDSALIIDAMDLLYAGNVEAFALVSSDSDFTGLALRLRESGKVVYGLGRQRTPQSLQNACDRFIALEVLGEEPAEPAGTSGRSAGPDAPDGADGLTEDDAPQLNLESALTRAVNATADDEGWTSVSSIGNHLSRTQASFDPRNFGHAKLSSLVGAQPYLESRPEGRQILVRLKGTPAKTGDKGADKATDKATDKAAGDKAPAAKTAPARAEPATSEPATTETTSGAGKGSSGRGTRAATKKAPTKAAASKTAAAKSAAKSDATKAPATKAPAAEAPEAKAPVVRATKTTRTRTPRVTKAAEAPAPEAATPQAEATPPSVAGSATTRPTVTRTQRRTATRKAPASES
ncbi:NYN domain-containing protein [Nocardioides sp. Soil805]|uniref:NYN domain-containing protein n=1 Tax=Nocardioides sp. Soil805 TaxID=1736416 RepID=UPI0009EB6FBF|nr:NYN domain-containing protein [Nocardioides sp. Soil805]